MSSKNTLRTLKEIEINPDNSYSENEEERIKDYLFDLKSEAVKCGRSERIEHMTARDFIIWFFDVEEADLQEKK